MFLLVYYAIKLTFLFSLVRSLVKYDTLRDHCLFLAILYTGGVAGLSWVFFLSWRPVVDWRAWEVWIGVTSVLAYLYFRLLARFDGGIMLYALILLGFGLIYY